CCFKVEGEVAMGVQESLRRTGASEAKPAVQWVQGFDDGAVRAIGQRFTVAADRMRFPAQVDHEFGHRARLVRDLSVDPEPGGTPGGSPGGAEFEGFVAGCLAAR